MCRALFLAVVFVYLAASPATAQDSVKVDPKHNKVEFENEQVRVLRTHVAPQESIPMHEHPANIVIWLTDSRNKVTLADGTTQERQSKAGAVSYRPGEKHAVQNVSDKDYEVIIVELKAKPAATN